MEVLHSCGIAGTVLQQPLGGSIDVFGNGSNVLGYPCRGRSSRRHERITKDAGSAGENKQLGASSHGLFQQIEGTSDIGIDEGLSAVGVGMRLVQRGYIWRLACMQCTNDVASCCDGAGSQQPERVPEV